MKKKKTFKDTRFDADILSQAFDYIVKSSDRIIRFDLHVRHTDGAMWQYDDVAEFLADYRIHQEYAYLAAYGEPVSLQGEYSHRDMMIAIEAPDRGRIATAFEIFERVAAASKLPPALTPVVESASPVIFIGHGRGGAWRDLKDHLQDKHGYRIEAYETGARAGHTIRDILEEMVRKSSFAILVFTAEDEQADGQFRARQNVVHEAGLFQGRLGFPRAIVLSEEGVEIFSNIDGIQYIPFSKGNIKETYGEVLATIRREFSFT